MQNKEMASVRLFIVLLPITVFADWPQFLGPMRDGKAHVAGQEFSANGFQHLWDCPRGESYSAPSMADGKLIHHFRFQGLEKVECRTSSDGKLIWSDSYETSYRDRFNYLNGPRSSPAIKDGQVFTLGAQGVLSCYGLEKGTLIWRRDLVKEFDISTEFFGFATSPLIEGDALIINLGMKKCVASFDLKTGKTNWVSGKEWGRSYASPVAATVYEKRILLVFAGGESSPPVGGLLCQDPISGKIYDRFPWRSPKHASVNASTPVVNGNRVFISSSYDVGGIMLEIQPDFTFKEIYRTKAYASHWATPILVDGYLYGFSNNKLVCMNWKTGERVWREVPKVGNAAFQTLEAGKAGAAKYRPPPGQDGFGIGNLTYVGGKFLCLGENGLLAWMKLSPEGCEILSWQRLFTAKQTWAAPVFSNGKIFIGQNLPDPGKSEPRLIALRAEPNG